jgi:NAD+ kinase
MKIAIYSRGGESVNVQDLKILLQALQEQKCSAYLYESYFQQVKEAVNPSSVYSVFNSSSDLDDSFDCMISLGGDGTLLDTVTLIRDKNIPVLGINFGRLGFLASLGKEDIHAAVSALVNRTFTAEKRSLVHLEADIPLFGDTPYALNEFAIHKETHLP